MNAPARTPLSAREAHADRVYRGLCDQAKVDAVAVAVACDTVLQGIQDRLPPPEFQAATQFWSNARYEAEQWAEYASDAQIAAMMAACLDRIGGARLVANDRKRLMVALWNSLGPEDRQAFREKVAGK